MGQARGRGWGVRGNAFLWDQWACFVFQYFNCFPVFHEIGMPFVIIVQPNFILWSFPKTSNYNICTNFEVGDELSWEKCAHFLWYLQNLIFICYGTCKTSYSFLSTVGEKPTLRVSAAARMRVNTQSTGCRRSCAVTLVVHALNLCMSVTCHIWAYFYGAGKFIW